MKIAFLNKYQNKVNRGAETYVYELSQRLSKNHKVDIYSDIDYLKLFKEKYDLIIPTNGRFQAFIVRIITLLTKGKMIISGQSGIGLDDRINLYSFPNAFVALSAKALKWAKEINPSVKSFQIPNGVDIKKFYPSSTSDRKGYPVILSVGAFTKEKRHDLTIKAVSKLKDAKLIIAGGGGQAKDEILKMGNSLLGKERFEVISLSHDEMPGVYRKADVFAFPTVPWESFGIAILEAMASNLPIVATNDEIRKEIIGDAGILIDPQNTDEYADALSRAINKNWGNLPRKQAEKFSWDNIGVKYEDLIGKLFNK